MTRNKRIGIASLTLIPPFLLVINFIDILGLSIATWAFAFYLLIFSVFMLTRDSKFRTVNFVRNVLLCFYTYQIRFHNGTQRATYLSKTRGKDCTPSREKIAYCYA